MTGTAGALVVVVTAITGAFTIGSERVASDMISGVKLLFLRYYKVGDYVTMDGYFGRVIEITMTHTALVTIERDKILIPNSDAIEGPLVNHSKIPGYRVLVEIPIRGEYDLKEAMRIIKDTADNFEGKLDGGEYQPIVIYDDVVSGADVYKIWLYVEEWPITIEKTSELRIQIAEALKARGIVVGVAQVMQWSEGLGS